MSKLFAFAPALMPALLGPLVAYATFGAGPAQAQYYYRPYYEPRYVEPLYDEPPPGYYRVRPRVYREPPMREAPLLMPRADVQPLLRSMGMVSIARPRTDGNIYVTEATDPSGQRMRVRIDARSGSIVSMRPIAQPAPVGRNAPLPPMRPPEVETSALPAPAATPEPATPPVAAVPPSEKPMGPDTAPAPPKQAAAPAPASTEVRVIPGVALPPGTALKVEAKTETPPAATSAPAPAGNAAAGTGTGTGTGTGVGSASAGTASVVARDGRQPPAPTAD